MSRFRLGREVRKALSERNIIRSAVRSTKIAEILRKPTIEDVKALIAPVDKIRQPQGVAFLKYLAAQNPDTLSQASLNRTEIWQMLSEGTTAIPKEKDPRPLFAKAPYPVLVGEGKGKNFTYRIPSFWSAEKLKRLFQNLETLESRPDYWFYSPIPSYYAPIIYEGIVPWRYRLQISEPTENNEQCRVRWMIQDSHLPSQSQEGLIPLTPLLEVPEDDLPDCLRRYGAHSKKGLTTMQGLLPQLFQGYHGHMEADGSLSLSLKDLTRFQRKGIEILTLLGIPVDLPESLADLGIRPQLRRKRSPLDEDKAHLNKPDLSAEGLYSFDWRIGLGHLELKPEEMREILAQAQEFQKPHGKYVYLDSETRRRIDVMLDHIALRESQPMPEALVKAHQSFLELSKGLSSFDWVGEPDGFHPSRNLLPHQVTGVSWLVGMLKNRHGACLADYMGLGKTVQSLAAYRHLRGINPEQPSLLICPKSLLYNWANEVARFTPDVPVIIYRNSQNIRYAPKKSLEKASLEDRSRSYRISIEAYHRLLQEVKPLVISSYGTLAKNKALFQRPWGMLIADEVHRIRNKGKAYIAVNQLNPFVSDRIGLTGTPIHKNYQELQAVMEFVYPELKNNESFQDLCSRSRDVDQQVRITAQGTLKKMVFPFLLRRLTRDMPGMPMRIDMPAEEISLSPEQTALYLKTLDEMLRLKAKKKPIVGEITRLRQICAHPALVLGPTLNREDYLETLPLTDSMTGRPRSNKLQHLGGQVHQAVSQGNSCLVFTQFKEMAHLIKRQLDAVSPEANTAIFHGELSDRQQDKLIRQFQDKTDKDRPKVMVLTPAGSEGITLTMANHVFFYDLPWNSTDFEQMVGRADRTGQQKPVVVHRLISPGDSIESKTLGIHAYKKALTHVLPTDPI